MGSDPFNTRKIVKLRVSNGCHFWPVLGQFWGHTWGRKAMCPPLCPLLCPVWRHFDTYVTPIRHPFGTHYLPELSGVIPDAHTHFPLQIWPHPIPNTRKKVLGYTSLVLIGTECLRWAMNCSFHFVSFFNGPIQRIWSGLEAMDHVICLSHAPFWLRFGCILSNFSRPPAVLIGTECLTWAMNCSFHFVVLFNEAIQRIWSGLGGNGSCHLSVTCPILAQIWLHLV